MNLKQLPKIPIQLILMFILSSANLDTFAQATRPAVPLRIDFEAIVRQDTRLNLSEIVDNIEYIPLETKKEYLIGEVDAIDMIESMNTKKAGELDPKYAHKRKAFMELAKGLKEDDNPVIQVLHLN